LDIQAAVDGCAPGDTIEVLDGTYTGAGFTNVAIPAKALVLRSQSGDPSTCVIDCENVSSRRGFSFGAGVGLETIVEGFTVTRGRYEDGGTTP
jgi:hypothetical protein